MPNGPRPIADVEVYARPLGRLAWHCPDCGKHHKKQLMPWRNAHITCAQCKHAFRLGVGFNAVPVPALWMGRWNGSTANRLYPEGKPIAAELFSDIEWLCPMCARPHLGTASDLDCECGAKFYINLLFYRAASNRVVCPYDWLIYGSKKTPRKSVSAPETHSSRGEAGRSS